MKAPVVPQLALPGWKSTKGRQEEDPVGNLLPLFTA